MRPLVHQGWTSRAEVAKLDAKDAGALIAGLAVLVVGIVSDGALQVVLLIVAVAMLLFVALGRARRGKGDSPTG